MTNGLASTPPQQQQQREDGFGVWGGPVGPEHSVDAYGLMHPHDALEITRDRTRRSMTVPQRILVAGDEGGPGCRWSEMCLYACMFVDG